MQKLTLNYTRVQEHAHLLIHVHEHVYVVYVHVFILSICARRQVNECAVTSERIVFS